MLFPTIEEYKDAIRIAEHSLATLKEYEVVKTAAGEPWFSSGGFAVVFKMKHRSTGKLLALKCFTRFQERRQESYKLISAHLGTNKSTYLLHYNYLGNEIWAAGAEYPVVAMEWADGATLGDYVKEQCRLNNKPNLQALAKNFEALTAWLITQPFAHGDLKPDNIIVRSDGSLALVDYDGMFVPAMQGQSSREFGSPVYRHPKRTIDTFDRYIDDFSLLVLLLELRLIAADTKHYSAALSGDSIVAKSGDWEDVANSRIYQALQAQGRPDWAIWAEILLILPKNSIYQINDWAMLIETYDKLIITPKIITPPIEIFMPHTATGFTDPFEGQMVFVQGGTFMMGNSDGEKLKSLLRFLIPERKRKDSSYNENGKPIHQVTLSDFYISKFQVMQAQWETIMGNNPSRFKGRSLPVDQISWNDIQVFLQKINEKSGRKYRLPTEAEWEYAARGGQQSRGYLYAGGNNIDEVAWYWKNSGEKKISGEMIWENMHKNNCQTRPVGQKKPNELGLFDMSGNVTEWCNDGYNGWIGRYSETPQTNPMGLAYGTSRVLRGGAWDTSSESCRVAYRNGGGPDIHNRSNGFRLASTR
jgi:formylglycine-generating enzyme required for sulfatase activity